MLKIKNDDYLDKAKRLFDLDEEVIDGDYEFGVCGDIEYSKGGVFISLRNKQIYGIDCSNLDLLYDLIKADLVEKVDDK